MLINLYKTASAKADKEFYNFLTGFLKTMDKVPVRNSYQGLRDYFALYLTIQ